MAAQPKIILTAEDRTSAAFKQVQSSFQQTIGQALSLKTAAAGFAGVFSATAVLQYTKGLAQAGVEADRLARLAGTSVRDFQAQAFAADRAGISSEKYADILKDVQDKVGDFVQNGAGPLKDFFDNIAPKVGVTAEQFRKLGGADALQLYVNSLEKANLSQSELTFYMEAIASDSALLLPLLKNNGAEMKKFGDQAERLGLVLDQKAIAELKRFDDELRRFEASAAGFGRAVALPIIEWVNRMSQEFQTGMKYADGFFDAIFTFGGAGSSENAAGKLRQYTDELQKLRQAREDLIDREGNLANTSGFDRQIEAAQKRVAYFNDLMRGRWNLSGQRLGVNDPRVIGAAPLDETAGFRAGSAAGAKPAKAPKTARATAEVIRPDLELDAISAEFEQLNRLQDQRADRARQIYADLLTPIEELAKAESELETLRRAGLLTEETYSRARLAAAQAYEEAMQNGRDATDETRAKMDELSEAALRSAERIQDALGDQVFNLLDGRFDDIGDAFANMLKRMASEALAANLTNLLFGSVGSGKTGSTGLLGGLGSLVLGSFEGGGYTGSGARTGGVDGRGGFLSVLHPDETVIDHTRGQSMAAPVINIYNTIGSVASQADVVAGMQQTRAQIMGELQRRNQYGVPA